MHRLVTATLLAVGIIHLLPLAGALGVDRLKELYGVTIEDRNLGILMRHRAVLFGLLGAFLIVAGFVPSLQLSAFVLGFFSVASFLFLAWTTGGYNAQIKRVIAIDLLALLFLIFGFAIYLLLAGFAFMVLPLT